MCFIQNKINFMCTILLVQAFLTTGCVEIWYADEDGDGYGDPNVTFAESGPGRVQNNSDCNDADTEINPAAMELKDGYDNDCDRLVDSDADTTSHKFVDVLVIGDSVMYGLAASKEAASDAYPIYKKYIDYKFAYEAVPADDTVNLMTRLLNGMLDQYTADLVVVGIGTNNLKLSRFTESQDLYRRNRGYHGKSQYEIEYDAAKGNINKAGANFFYEDTSQSYDSLCPYSQGCGVEQIVSVLINRGFHNILLVGGYPANFTAENISSPNLVPDWEGGPDYGMRSFDALITAIASTRNGNGARVEAVASISLDRINWEYGEAKDFTIPAADMPTDVSIPNNSMSSAFWISTPYRAYWNSTHGNGSIDVHLKWTGYKILTTILKCHIEQMMADASVQSCGFGTVDAAEVNNLTPVNR